MRIGQVKQEKSVAKHCAGQGVLLVTQRSISSLVVKEGVLCASPVCILHGDFFALNLLAWKVVFQRDAALDLKSQRQKSCTKGHCEPKRDAEGPDCRRHRDVGVQILLSATASGRRAGQVD